MILGCKTLCMCGGHVWLQCSTEMLTMLIILNRVVMGCITCFSLLPSPLSLFGGLQLSLSPFPTFAPSFSFYRSIVAARLGAARPGSVKLHSPLVLNPPPLRDRLGDGILLKYYCTSLPGDVGCGPILLSFPNTSSSPLDRGIGWNPPSISELVRSAPTESSSPILKIPASAHDTLALEWSRSLLDRP